MADVPKPKTTQRATSAGGEARWIYELFLAPGPQTVGSTGDNSYTDLFGRNYLLVLSEDDGYLHLFGESDIEGVWDEITVEGNPAFASELPADARRISLAFDQSARVIVAYETDGLVKVTRWDIDTASYLQNVSFAGTNPCLINDASFSFEVGGSDVIIFYQDESDLTNICYRIQRETYGTEHVLITDASIGILDRAVGLAYCYELLVSDANGDALEQALLSELYPVIADNGLTLTATTPVSGLYDLVVTVHEASDGMTGSASPPASGLYDEPIITETEDDGLTGTGDPPSSGDYVSVVITETPDTEGVTGSVTPPASGDYENVVLSEEVSGGITGTATGPSGGVYEIP